MPIDRRQVLAGLAALSSASALGIMPRIAWGQSYAPLLDHGYTLAPCKPGPLSGCGIWHFHARDAEQWAIRHLATSLTFIRVPWARGEYAMRLTRRRSEPDINHSSARKTAFESHARNAYDVAEVVARHALRRNGAVLVALDDGTVKLSDAPPLWAAMSGKPRLYSPYPA